MGYGQHYWSVLPYREGRRGNEREQEIEREEIEQGFLNAGWEIDGGFSDHLVIGYDGDGISLLAHKEAWGTEITLFEILDHERMGTYWVHEVPTPQRAAKLLHEHGESLQEKRNKLGMFR